jgi:hypothetical protein
MADLGRREAKEKREVEVRCGPANSLRHLLGWYTWFVQGPAHPDSLHFQRAKRHGLILVLNQGCYLMAEYLEETGEVRWHRLVGASQRAATEKMLLQQFPPTG